MNLKKFSLDHVPAGSSLPPAPTKMVKVKIGGLTTTYTYFLGRIPVAKIIDQMSYGVSYQPITKQHEERVFYVSFDGCHETLRTFEEAEQEIKHAAQGKFLQLDLSISKYGDVADHEIPENVNV